MKNEVRYSPLAQKDLDEIWDNITLEFQDASAAERVVSRYWLAPNDLKALH